MPNQRTKRIVVRVSTEEHWALSDKARGAGITLSALVRDHINRVRVYNHAEKEAWLRALVAMNNMTAALARTASVFNPFESVVALAYLAAIHRQLDQVAKLFPAHAREILPSRNGKK
jgi:hypothetical protein